MDRKNLCKIYFQLILLFVFPILLHSEQTYYSIVLCDSQTEQKALECQSSFSQSFEHNSSIYNKSGNYKTILGEFKSIEEAKKYRFYLLTKIDRKYDLSIESIQKILPKKEITSVSLTEPDVKKVSISQPAENIKNNDTNDSKAKVADVPIKSPVVQATLITKPIATIKSKKEDMNSSVSLIKPDVKKVSAGQPAENQKNNDINDSKAKVADIPIKTPVIQATLITKSIATIIPKSKKEDMNYSVSLIKPAVKKQVVNLADNNKSRIVTVNEESKKQPIHPKNIIVNPFKMELTKIDSFDNLSIEVDSLNHELILYGFKNTDQFILRKYNVSTARKSVKKPLGIGGISSVSLAPNWYPTQKTIEYFREKKGINLPDVVEYGDPNNYMGAAKINLTHIVDGKSVYRIHGTINESTIGSNETSGCIRMKNQEVKELASALKKFISFKSLNKINVILK